VPRLGLPAALHAHPEAQRAQAAAAPVPAAAGAAADAQHFLIYATLAAPARARR